MPRYAYLASAPLDYGNIAANLQANAAVGVPYTQDDIANAVSDVSAQANPNADPTGLLSRYDKTPTGDFDGKSGAPTEMDALVAYLQMLGTLVDFKLYNEKANLR
jgi:cytochrome c oxidase cbb3-type subunit 2